MAFDTYSDLKAEIALWLNRQDLTTQIPSFVRLAEARFSRELLCRQQETRSTATLSEQFLALPTDFKSMKQLQVNSDPVAPLLFVAATELDKERQLISDVAGKPRLFSIIGSEIEFAPVPDAEYEVEMVYYAKITPLSDSATSNWLLTDHPDLYLYGSLMQAAPYLHDDERIPVWAQLVEKMMEEIRLSDERARAGNSPLRARIRPYGC